MEILSQTTKESNIKTTLSILANIKILSKEKAFCTFPTKTFIWETGNKINFLVMEYIFMPMEINIKENFFRVASLEEAFILIKVRQFMKENGLKTRKVGLEFIYMPTNKNTRAIG
jgi:hypothetical protein